LIARSISSANASTSSGSRVSVSQSDSAGAPIASKSSTIASASNRHQQGSPRRKRSQLASTSSGLPPRQTGGSAVRSLRNGGLSNRTYRLDIQLSSLRGGLTTIAAKGLLMVQVRRYLPITTLRTSATAGPTPPRCKGRSAIRRHRPIPPRRPSGPRWPNRGDGRSVPSIGCSDGTGLERTHDLVDQRPQRERRRRSDGGHDDPPYSSPWHCSPPGHRSGSPARPVVTDLVTFVTSARRRR